MFHDCFTLSGGGTFFSSRIIHMYVLLSAVQHDLLQKEVDRLRGVYCNRRRETLKPHDKIADAADHLDLQFSCLSLGSLNQLETGSVKEPGCVNRVAPHPCMMLQKS